MTDLDHLRQSQSDTLSVISHDIRAPLGVILGALAELSNPQVGALNDDQRTLLQLVRRSSEKLSRLANNVMFLNRIESARTASESAPVELVRHPSDLRVVVRRALEAFERSGEIGKITLTTALPDDSVMVSLDAERAGHLFANVLANALRFARRSIQVAIVSDAAGVHLVIEDDGPGFVPAAIPTVFDRALRASANPGKPPSGLGLFVAKGIADAHGARIVAENIPADPPAPDAPPTNVPPRPKGARLCVTFPIV